MISNVMRAASATLLMLSIGAAGIAEPAFAVFTDKTKGVSFRHPAAAAVKNGREDVSVILLGDPRDPAAPVAMVTLGLITPEDPEVNALDERGFLAYTAGLNEGISQTAGPTAATVAGRRWLTADFRLEEAVMKLLVCKAENAFFGIVYYARPAAAAVEYEDEFQSLLAGLKLDVALWAESVKKKPPE